MALSLSGLSESGRKPDQPGGLIRGQLGGKGSLHDLRRRIGSDPQEAGGAFLLGSEERLRPPQSRDESGFFHHPGTARSVLELEEEQPCGGNGRHRQR